MMKKTDMIMLFQDRNWRFTGLFFSLLIMLVSYPFFGDNATGAALGGLTSLLILGAGVYALRTCRWSWILSGTLALCALGASLLSLLGQVRGSVDTEISFTAYYVVTTVAVFMEVIRLRRFNMDSVLGAVSIYLLIGVTF